jgi:hypothetical protein
MHNCTGVTALGPRASSPPRARSASKIFCITVFGRILNSPYEHTLPGIKMLPKDWPRQFASELLEKSS